MTHVTVRCADCGQPIPHTVHGEALALATHDCPPRCSSPGCTRWVLVHDNDRCSQHQREATT